MVRLPIYVPPIPVEYASRRRQPPERDGIPAPPAPSGYPDVPEPASFVLLLTARRCGRRRPSQIQSLINSSRALDRSAGIWMA
jgi:hypothetical protein